MNFEHDHTEQYTHYKMHDIRTKLLKSFKDVISYECYMKYLVLYYCRIVLIQTISTIPNRNDDWLLTDTCFGSTFCEPSWVKLRNTGVLRDRESLQSWFELINQYPKYK